MCFYLDFRLPARNVRFKNSEGIKRGCFEIYMRNKTITNFDNFKTSSIDTLK